MTLQDCIFQVECLTGTNVSLITVQTARMDPQSPVRLGKELSERPTKRLRASVGFEENEGNGTPPASVPSDTQNLISSDADDWEDEVVPEEETGKTSDLYLDTVSQSLLPRFQTLSFLKLRSIVKRSTSTLRSFARCRCPISTFMGVSYVENTFKGVASPLMHMPIQSTKTTTFIST